MDHYHEGLQYLTFHGSLPSIIKPLTPLDTHIQPLMDYYHGGCTRLLKTKVDLILSPSLHHDFDTMLINRTQDNNLVEKALSHIQHCIHPMISIYST
jgi:hypothetical protein